MMIRPHGVILLLAVAAELIRSTLAYCPNSCNNHGSCGKFDICTCVSGANGDPLWTGADCSSRMCPKDVAFIGDVVAANDVHPLAECSNKGECDRNTGQCICYKGFEGIACERTACPNSCHNNGVCYTQQELAEDAGREYDIPWDAEKMYGCVCDMGYRGIDCSLVECPSSVDPLGGPGSESGWDCSGRGICNYGKGICDCFKGYYGRSCEQLAVVVM